MKIVLSLEKRGTVIAAVIAKLPFLQIQVAGVIVQPRLAAPVPIIFARGYIARNRRYCSIFKYDSWQLFHNPIKNNYEPIYLRC
ncbi:hypothetical protein COY95_02950 [Candidatus Woesearchaeota archaeon CG_4_10_14_0_8_um_filter_47_5]|nr:MAG: hypothetical protein COY95_02950 [Candidatus Woesearchaeota archaeon CG_4_10_14_0_8_um_filter_47_5]